MKKYLTVQGYGPAVQWRYIYAESIRAIELAFEGLTIYEKPPGFWTDQMEKRTDSCSIGAVARFQPRLA